MVRGAVPRAAGAVLARAVVERGGALLARTSGRIRAGTPRPPDESRLYARRGHRIGAHLTRFPDGRRAIVALPLDGSTHAQVYVVGRDRPWEDFERRARLAGAAWGPCRDPSAGL